MRRLSYVITNMVKEAKTMNERNIWIDIITKLYTNLHKSKRLKNAAKESDKKETE